MTKEISAAIEIQLADLDHPSQAEAVVRLMDSYASDLAGGGQVLSEDVKKRLPSELAKRKNCLVFLAWSYSDATRGVERLPAGLAVCFEGFSTFACKPLMNIHDVIVSPDFRRRGIAKQLFQRIETISRERGCCKLTLEVLEGNHGAVDLYRSIGFQAYQLDSAMGKAMFWQKQLEDN